jgi:hypothetical protein
VQHGLDGGEHVVLRDEAHLEVELVELAGCSIGARVLVAEAGCDLEVAVEPGHHQQLLEHLRRLRQRIELAGMEPARHQVGTRALGAVGGQDRRLELGEALLDHAAAQGGDHLAAQHDVPVQLVLAQVEEAVLQSQLLRGGVVLLVDRDRQRLGHRLHDHVGSVELDLAGGELGVHCRGFAHHHLAAHRDDALAAHRLGRLEHRARDVDHDLGHPVMVAQIDEQQVPMVALALDPARQTGLLADVLGPQLAARMGSINRGHPRFPGVNGPAKGTDRRAKSRESPAFRAPPLCLSRLARYRAFQ